jgi:S1-C subfamily serine protease
MQILTVLTTLLISNNTIIPQAQAFDLSPLKTEKIELLDSEKNTIEVFKDSSSLVVSVDSTRVAADFFNMNYQEVPTGSGSGFIWDEKGHVITNFHVIQNALATGSHITITTKDNIEYKAKIIGSEPRKDIAVLELKNYKSTDQKGFKYKIANSKNLQVGQKVLAIGNPFGFEQTLTQGIVSAVDRSMPSIMPSVTIRDMIQTDASINPGNSGGPLIDSRGQLLGMNTAIISGSGSSAGIGFAVPSNTIHRIVNQIIEHGKVIQPGIGIVPLDNYRTKLLSRYGYSFDSGVIIESVTPNTPAAQAGLMGLEFNKRKGLILGDIITEIDNKKIKDFDDLYNLLSEKNVGEKVKIKIKRKNKILSKEISLQELNQQS